MQKTEKPRKQPKQARSQAMVENILAATARVLIARGYARTNTNLVAEEAGISVGSLYQYFPNKDALFSALHERHDRQIQDLIEQTLARLLAQSGRMSLRQAIAALIQAWIQAHWLAPELHRILEAELPFFEPAESEAERRIQAGLRELLLRHQAELGPQDVNVASWLVFRTIESLVHAIVLDPPPGLSGEALETGILSMVMGYLSVPSKTN